MNETLSSQKKKKEKKKETEPFSIDTTSKIYAPFSSWRFNCRIRCISRRRIFKRTHRYTCVHTYILTYVRLYNSRRAKEIRFSSTLTSSQTELITNQFVSNGLRKRAFGVFFGLDNPAKRWRYGLIPYVTLFSMEMSASGPKI